MPAFAIKPAHFCSAGLRPERRIERITCTVVYTRIHVGKSCSIGKLRLFWNYHENKRWKWKITIKTFVNAKTMCFLCFILFLHLEVEYEYAGETI
jgi:hypothetical protein